MLEETGMAAKIDNRARLRPCRLLYSERSTVIGSVRDALAAGTKEASAETAIPSSVQVGSRLSP